MLASAIPEVQGWASRLQRLLPPEARAQTKTAEPAPAALLPQDCRAAKFEIAGQDWTPRIHALLSPFVDACDRAAAASFVTQARSLAAELPVPELATGLNQAAQQLETILASPLDLDANLLGIVWDAFAPVLAKFCVRPAAKPATEAAPKAAEPVPAAANAKGRFVRVKEECLESFVSDVSRLFITCERLKDLHGRMADEKLLSGLVDELKQINAAFYSQTNALQGSVVALRNVPVQALFGKFPRMARSLASNLGKQLDVTLIGEEIGIDKSLVEELDAPLTHMIRNVCDHAIETPDERRDCGKPETGQLVLRCELTRSHVVITIDDDGRGIDPVRLRKKAVEKGLLAAEAAAALSDQEAIELIFHPGFSTAEQITEVSGRGVGMDVVRTTLRQHDGDVTVTSHVGIGTTFRLTIPIRQAVLVVDGLLVRDGDGRYVVPLEYIREIVELRPSDLQTVHNAHVAVIRGEPLAALPLANILHLPAPPNADNLWHGIVLKTKEGSLCLLTERILGQRKVVINSLREMLPGVDKIAGVAQLGGGKLALVLSAPDIVKTQKAEPALG
jgi:two-component system chemotaxis sensor kinase CheA